MDVLYRIAGRPETNALTLPPDSENEDFNAASPYYSAVCWAWQTGLLRQDDLCTNCTDKVDYQTACLLIYRYAAMAGVDTAVDRAQLLETIQAEPQLSIETIRAMLWCNQEDITTRDSDLPELLDAADTRISRYQMTSFLFYLCTYELSLES